MEHLIVCPVCRGALTQAEGGYLCPLGHRFDTARRGYTNLLLGHSPGGHGDNREMILARQAFLGAGHYAPLLEALTHRAEQYFPEGGLLVDAGCGEGYYTDGALRALASRGARGIGIDISKEALRAAGTRPSVKGGALTLLVAGVYDMPLSDGCADMVLNFFAPLAREEYLRILRQDGILIMAIPARRHLFELKQVLYDTPYENEVQDFALAGFRLLHEDLISTRLSLDGSEQIGALFSMTPYYFRTPREGKERLARLSHLDVTAEFHLLTYRRSLL
ncbi:MAG: methyltransferase domain-containing protein [Clostridia bacterium]|nr:methyltransferase domain-containing protein [Clostridia bacterium]